MATAVIRMSVTPDDLGNRVWMLDLFQRRNARDGLNAREEELPNRMNAVAGTGTPQPGTFWNCARHGS